MSPLVPVPRDVRRDQIYRDAFLAQPLEYFRVHFGRIPDQWERVWFVEKFIQVLAAPRVFANDTYYIQVRYVPPFIQLNISRRDGEPQTSWRDFQQIKNELIGPENEGVELFPAESRLVDTAHQYHLWVMADARYRFTFGYQHRLVFDRPIVYCGETGEPVTPDVLPASGDHTAAAIRCP